MMQVGKIYDAVNDVDGRFSEEFKKYVLENNLVCTSLWESLWGPNMAVFTKTHEPGVFNSDVSFNHFLNDIALRFTRGSFSRSTCLVQFWRAEEVSNIVDGFVERRFLLTTRNQPFLLYDYSSETRICEGICSYRMKTRDVIITRDERVGPISRVFKNKRMEVTPDVRYYSYEEYPQQKMALSCSITSSVVIPLSDSYGRTTGVIECVAPDHMVPALINYLFKYFQEKNDCKNLCGQVYHSEKDLLRSDVSEIKEVMKDVCESCDIVCAQTWILCKRCNSLSNHQKWGKTSGAWWDWADIETSVWEIEFRKLQNGEEIVGKAAASSPNLVYCKDIAKFSIAEYPMAHFSRLHNLSACFAICLGSKDSEDRAHVLEFFLDSSSVKGRDPRAILVPTLNVMRHKFRTYKMASGGELRDSLSIQVIDASFPDKFETLEIGAIEGFRTFKVAYGSEEIGDNLFVLAVDASSPDKVKTLKNESIDLTWAIGVKNVKAFNFPFYSQQSIGESSGNETDDPMIGVETPFQDISMDDVPVASASTVQSEIKVTIKANYGGDFVRFQLCASLGIHELHRQVSQRLGLKVGTYLVKYQDDDKDWIIIACDEDLWEYISTSQENYTLMVSIELKRASPL